MLVVGVGNIEVRGQHNVAAVEKCIQLMQTVKNKDITIQIYHFLESVLFEKMHHQIRFRGTAQLERNILETEPRQLRYPQLFHLDYGKRLLMSLKTIIGSINEKHKVSAAGLAGL
jgi:hypothetical protein